MEEGRGTTYLETLPLESTPAKPRPEPRPETSLKFEAARELFVWPK
jgi:hypothetical protein